MAGGSDRRQANLSVSLGDHQVMLERLTSTEPLGLEFRMTIDIIGTLGEIDLLPHMGKPIVVHAYEDDTFMRHFHSVIIGGEFTRQTAAGYHYRLATRAFTYFLAGNRNMAIFQDLSVPEIIAKVLNAAGQPHFELKLSKTYPKRDYCVQYRESDYTFILRLMEEEGIYAFYRHAADKHVLVLCDMPSAHGAASPPELHYSETAASVGKSGSVQRNGNRYYAVNMFDKHLTQGENQVTLRAFDFKKPDTSLEAQAHERTQHPADTHEVYDYPGDFLDTARGEALGAVRLSALRRQRQVFGGRSDAIGLTSGTKVTIKRHPTARFNQQYLIVGTQHSIANERYYSAHPGEISDGTYVDFELIPAETKFHLPSKTPRPVVHGLESAIVSGPAGEEIFTDPDGYGRVKVRFHWDRSGTTGENSTCWIRVAQFGGLGSVILPRVNQEVMVDFLHGDPDQPIVMGWVFNKNHMPIYDLPANKTRAVWRTKRYGEAGAYLNAKALDTGAPGANELRFEDKGGSEEVFLHAERDMNTRIRFAETHHVGQNQAIDIGQDRTSDVHGNETTTIDLKETHHVKGDQEVNIDATRIVTVKADDELDAKQTLTINVGTDLKITANQSITLTCGMSTIEMKPGQITIKSPQVTVQGQATAKLTSPMTTVEGTGLTKITGGLVTIN